MNPSNEIRSTSPKVNASDVTKSLGDTIETYQREVSQHFEVALNAETLTDTIDEFQSINLQKLLEVVSSTKARIDKLIKDYHNYSPLPEKSPKSVWWVIVVWVILCCCITFAPIPFDSNSGQAADLIRQLFNVAYGLVCLFPILVFLFVILLPRMINDFKKSNLEASIVSELSDLFRVKTAVENGKYKIE